MAIHHLCPVAHLRRVAALCLRCVVVLPLEKKAKQTAAVQKARTALLSKGRSPHLFLSNIVEVFMEGARTYALVDTGAAVSVIDGTLYRTLQKVTTSLSGLFLRKQMEKLFSP